MDMMSSYQVAIGAEAFAAGIFAQAGCDVSVQYGANQPEYDLKISKGDQILKVSVKGSQDGGWGINQGFKNKNRSYHEATDIWVKRHKSKTIYCFVQFKNIKLGECPRIYLATIEEIANALKNARNGYGETILWEYHEYTRGVADKTIDEIPASWQFSKNRLDQLLNATL